MHQAVVGIPARDGWRRSFHRAERGKRNWRFFVSDVAFREGGGEAVRDCKLKPLRYSRCVDLEYFYPCSYLFPSDFRTNVCAL